MDNINNVKKCYLILFEFKEGIKILGFYWVFYKKKKNIGIYVLCYGEYKYKISFFFF